MLEQHQPHRGHARGVRHLLGREQLVDRGAIELGAGHDELGALRWRGEGDAPAIGMEQRNHRQHRLGRAGAERIDIVGHQCVQHVGAMRVQHTLRIARGSRRVTHRGRRVLVKVLPFELAVDLRDPVLVGDHVLQIGLGHMRLVGQHDVAFHARQLVGDLLQDRDEGDVGHHDAVLRMVDDPGDLLGEKAGIDGMANGADPHDAVPDFEMAPGVPGDRCDTVAELDPVTLEHLRDLQRALVNLTIGGAMDRSLDRPCDNLLLAMNSGGVFDDPVAEQGPILHQTKHSVVPPRWAGPVIALSAGPKHCHEF